MTLTLILDGPSSVKQECSVHNTQGGHTVEHMLCLVK